MRGQINLFAEVPTEQWVYETLLPSLKQGLNRSNAGETNVSIERGKEYSSVSYLKQDPYDPQKTAKKHLAFRVCCRNGVSFFGVSNSYLDLVSENLMPYRWDSAKNDGFSNFTFEPTEEGIEKYASFLSSVMDAVTYGLLKEFDCCSRVEECSNAKRCIHPNPAMATSCGYRKILKSGRIFYGKNRNTH